MVRIDPIPKVPHLIQRNLCSPPSVRLSSRLRGRIVDTSAEPAMGPKKSGSSKRVLDMRARLLIFDSNLRKWVFISFIFITLFVSLGPHLTAQVSAEMFAHTNLWNPSPRLNCGTGVDRVYKNGQHRVRVRKRKWFKLACATKAATKRSRICYVLLCSSFAESRYVML